jgi:hypothetical protein
MAHDLLNRILRASERLSPGELEMLMNVARRLKDEAAAVRSAPGLHIIDTEEQDDTDGLCIQDIE